MKRYLAKHMKGQAGGLSGSFLAIVVALLVASFGALILSETGATMTADSAEYNITQTGITAVGDMSDLVAPLGIVLVAAVIIAVLMGAFRGR